MKNSSGSTLMIGSVTGSNNQSSLLKNVSMKKDKKAIKSYHHEKPKTTGSNMPI